MKAVKSVDIVSGKVVVTFTDNSTEELMTLSSEGGGITPSELAEINRRLDVLTSEVAEMSTLEEGSTTGDAELINGRIGYDGEVYQNIGTAIREQVLNLHNEKMEYYILNFDGTKFTHDGTQLTFAQIREKCLDDMHFVYALYDNQMYIPQWVSASNVMFDSSYIRNDIPQMHRIGISSSGAINKYDFNLAKESELNSVASDLNGAKEDIQQLSESITEISNLEKKTDDALSMPTEWELGSIQADGSFSSSDTRYRTKIKTHFSDGTVFDIEDGYKYCIIGYHAEATSVGLYTGWLTSEYTLTKDVKAYVLLANNSNTSLRGTDYTALKQKLKIKSEYMIVDTIKKNFDMVDIIAKMKPQLKDCNSTTTEWELGSIQADGSFSSADKRYRTKTKEFFKKGTAFDVAEGYKYAIIAYYSGSASVSFYSGWMTEKIILSDDAMVYIVIATTSDDVLRTYDFNDLKSKVTIATYIPIVEKINELVPVGSSMTDYWKEYLDGKLSAIDEKVASIGNDGDYFQYFTDYHCTANVGKLNSITNYIKNKTNLKSVVFGGDILVSHNTKIMAKNYLKSFMDDFDDDLFFPVFGNHDVNAYYETARLTFGESYSILYKHKEHIPIMHMKNGGYYYVDNEAQKLRYIFLNTREKSDGSDWWNDTEQQEWFLDLLHNNKDGWGVVVFTHVFYATNEDTSAELTETYYSGRVLHGIMSAYNSKSSVTISQRNYDFTSSKGYVCAIITGHVHRDYSVMDASGFPIITTVCDTNQNEQNKYNTLDRTTGTINEHAIDLFFIDTTARTISTVRIGAGSDRSFSF